MFDVSSRSWPYVSVFFPPGYSCYPELASAALACQNQTGPQKCTAHFHGKEGATADAMAHEWGHNLGLGHSSMRNTAGKLEEVRCQKIGVLQLLRYAQQLGDPTSSMGNSLLGTCYSAPHLHALQWIRPQVVTQAQLPLGRLVSFTLNASTRGGPANGQPGRVALVVTSWTNRTLTHCSWSASVERKCTTTRHSGTDWYFNLLLREGPNRRLPERFHNKVAVHTWTRTAWPSFRVMPEFMGSMNTGLTLNITVRGASCARDSPPLRVST